MVNRAQRDIFVSDCDFEILFINASQGSGSVTVEVFKGSKGVVLTRRSRERWVDFRNGARTILQFYSQTCQRQEGSQAQLPIPH